LRLCFNTIGCRNDSRPLVEIVRGIGKAGGYEGIEVWTKDPSSWREEEATELAETCRSLGMQVPVLTCPLGELNGDMDDVEHQYELCKEAAELASALGAKMVRAFPGLVGEVTSRAPRPDYYQWVVAAFRRFCRLLEEYELELVSEVHWGTFADTADGAEKFLGDVSRDNHGLILQLGVVPRWSGLGPVEFYRRLAGHIRHMHLHPYPWQEHEDNMAGYARLLPVLERERPELFVSVENCAALVDPLEAAAWGRELVERAVRGEVVTLPPG
jgi:sugar phosphate isomerase/epimerase